ncbi:MAG: 3-hydroxyacyl-CoA dehydrogenase NAD-binding domain-containing protein [Enterobacteriaceae bacterium]
MSNSHPAVPFTLAGKRATVIGAGVIGSSWATLFLAHGMHVTINDPMPDIKNKVYAYIEAAIPSLQQLGLKTDQLTTHLSFESELSRAVASADYIQESALERCDFKASLWQQVEQAASKDALLLSSSSNYPASQQNSKMAQPERLIVGHPFNPPHLIPLVEVVPNPLTPPSLTARAMQFYQALGKFPAEIEKECPDFVVNRLQAAIFRECVNLVAQGVIKVDELDSLITHSVGIRWATGGPFLSFHLAGGPQGLQHFIEHLAPGMQQIWQEQQQMPVSFDEKTIHILLQQIEQSYGYQQIPQLAKQRDEQEIAVLNALSALAHKTQSTQSS